VPGFALACGAMTLDPRTPVLVGAAAVSQRLDDPLAAGSAIDLMVLACEQAVADAGCPDLLREAGAVYVPKGSWRFVDVARQVAMGVGNVGARAVEAELGILQTTLVRLAADEIAAGDLDVALVVGGEAKWREVRASLTGTELADAVGSGAPDQRLEPHGVIVSSDEVRAGLVTAVSQYSMLENALRHARGETLDEHARAVAALWARFNEVAQQNPNAWNRAPMTADDIRTPGPRNRPLAFPYNKWHNSQWNVDQAACLVLCSVETARAHGVAADRWVFPHAIVDSEHMVPVTNRAQLHRAPGFQLAGSRAFELAGVGVDEVAHVDLYSCFPVAVQVQAAELGLALDQQLTVTGGMTFGGGPLNNYVLQSTAAMAAELRRDAGSLGLVTAISGMITKQGVSIWSTEPPAEGYRSDDITSAVAAAVPVVETVVPSESDATVVTYTVLYTDSAPSKAVVVADRSDGGRAVAVSGDRDLLDAMTSEEWCGRGIALRDDATFTAD
jgi:acetyl-CoA C-acetyltransferase